MRNMKRLWMMGIALLVLAACSTPQPTAAPSTATPAPTASPTATPTPEIQEWDYVVLGDEYVTGIGSSSYATHYAAYIEADLVV